MGYLLERFGITMLPPKPGTCPECGVAHEEGWPHNRDSLVYQYGFYDKHGRWPSWGDAMAHCPDGVKAYWKEQLAMRGIDVNQVPETDMMSFEIKGTPRKPPVVVIHMSGKGRNDEH